jgi:hypothetical protein
VNRSLVTATTALPLLLGGALFGYVHHTHTIQMARLELLARTLSTSPVPAQDVPRAARLDSWMVDQLSRSVAEAVTARLGQSRAEESASPLPSPEAAEPASLSAKQKEALSNAHRLVDSAIGQGQLSQDVADELRRLRAEAGSGPEYQEIVQKIVVAINQDKLTPPSPNPALWMP